MKTPQLLVAAAVMLAGTLLTASEAEARRGWRQARWSQPRTVTVRRAYSDPSWSRSYRTGSGAVTYSGISRGEQNYYRRLDRWYQDAYNGFRPEDFR